MYKSIIKFGVFVAVLLLALPTIAASPTIDFSGYTWNIHSTGTGNPGNNNWNSDRESVFVDASGQLHLKIRKVADKWYSSSLHLDRSLGYGTYEYKLGSDINKQAFNTIIGLFLYQDDTHELDIELGKWTVATKNNLHYSVQPYSTTGNSIGFPLTVNYSESSYIIDWQPNTIKFYVMSAGQKLAEWEYKGANNFVPSKESVHINFWQIDGKAPADGLDQELVVKSFKFTPVNGNTTVAPVVVVPPVIVPAPVITQTPVIKSISTTVVPAKIVSPIKKLTPAQVKAQQKLERQKLEKKIVELKKELTKLQAQLKKMK